jgi:hypothetical protein
MSGRQRRVLLGQLGANGDCVYATTIARQIKAHDPDCHLTWAIGSIYRQVIEHNPHVDDIWEVEYGRRDLMISVWTAFEQEARRRQQRGDFDEVHLTQINPANFKNFDGTVRASIFRGYPRPITVPVTPVIRLSAEDIARVTRFAHDHRLMPPSGPVVLIESAPQSGQSPMTAEWATSLALAIINGVPTSRVITTSPIGPTNERRLIDASALRFRDVAELSRYCSLFVGCSSGLTWLLTSDAATTIPMIQVLASRVGDYGAVVHDLEYWGLPSKHVIELHDCSVEYAAGCASEVLMKGVAPVRDRYHEDLPLTFTHYLETMVPIVGRGHFRDFVSSWRHTANRYGWRSGLVRDTGRLVRSKVFRRLTRKIRQR